MSARAPRPPRAPRRSHRVVSPHGTREDPWFWLRDDERKDPVMLAHLRAENAWREHALGHLAGFEQQLYEEIVGRIKQDDASVPVRHNGWWYYTRYEAGREYPIYARKKGSTSAPEEILANANELAKGHDFYQIAALRARQVGDPKRPIPLLIRHVPSRPALTPFAVRG